MNKSENHLNQPDRSSEENDALWRLLGESPRPEPDAWFAARTLARCRYATPGVFSWLGFFSNWRRVLGTSLGLGLAVVLVARQLPSNDAAPDQQQNVQEAFAIMASLDSSSSSDTDSTSSSSSTQDSSL
jgi:hypothetical protein